MRLLHHLTSFMHLDKIVIPPNELNWTLIPQQTFSDKIFLIANTESEMMDQAGLHLKIAVSGRRWNFKPCPLPYQVLGLIPQDLVVMFQSHILIPQYLPVMMPMQQLDTPWEVLAHHHTLSTHNAWHWQFLNLCLDFSHIILQTLKKCLPLKGPCLHMGRGRGDLGTRGNYLPCSR